ncbi:MAG: Ig-like domain-containing protein [Thermoproteota archaeon]
MRKICRFACTSLCFVVLSLIIFIHPPAPAAALGDTMVELSFAPSAVEAGAAVYPIGYVRLVSNSTGEPVLAPSDFEVQLLSDDASIAFVPSRITIPLGSDYARFDVEVSDLTGETRISAIYGDRTSTKTFRVVDALNQVEDVQLVINLASDKMQVASAMPFSVYMENNGNVLQAQEDITIELDYESSLVQLSSSSLVIKKGSYYATGTIQTLEKSGNAFIKATADVGEQLNTVTNVEISQTQPVALKVYVFPDKVGLNENTIDIYVGVVDTNGQPTLAAEDIELELFSSAYQLTGISNIPAVIKKGEFGFYTRQYMNFYSGQNVTIGAAASGLGAGTAIFEVMEDSLGPTHAKALDKTLQVFTIEGMPGDAEGIAVYQLVTIEHDDDDCVSEDGTLLFNSTATEGEGGENEEGDQEFDCVDVDGDGNLNSRDWHPIDELEEGEFYPVESTTIYSQGQGNLNIVSGDNLAARVTDFGALASGSSYGTAKISTGRQADDVDLSVALSGVAVGSNTMTVVGGLNPTQTKIFSPGGLAPDGSYRVLFDRNGLGDLYVITLDSAGRPSNSELGVKYLVKPVNELTEIMAGTSFAHLPVEINSFKTTSDLPENSIKEISAVPVGVNSDLTLTTTSNMHLLFHTGTAAKAMLPFDSLVAFSKAHQIGVVQLTDVSGNPVLASDNVTVELSSSSLSSVLPVSAVVIPKGKSFANFNIATFGRADNFTIYATADGLQASSAELVPVVVELPASFVGSSAFATSVPIPITVSTPIEGVTITWGASSGLQLVGNATSFKPAGNTYLATMQVMSANPGTFTVDATLLKDGFKPTRISKELVIGPYQKQMNAVLIDNGIGMLAYNQPTLMQVTVKDANGIPVSGATVQVEDSGPKGLMLVSSVTTDETGTASFVYTPTAADQSSNLLTLMVTAYKDGYQPSRTSKVFEVDSSSAILPPIPVLGSTLGLPSWTTYAILGGVAAASGGFYFLRKPKPVEEEESLVEETSADVTEQTTEETIEDDFEDEEEEEDET